MLVKLFIPRTADKVPIELASGFYKVPNHPLATETATRGGGTSGIQDFHGVLVVLAGLGRDSHASLPLRPKG